MIEYYVLDTETTGLKVGFHEINQISIIRYSDKKKIDIDIAVKFPFRASYQALEIQQKSMNDLKNGIPLEEAIEKIDQFLLDDGNPSPGHRCIVAHNAAFDRKFCQFAWRENNKVFPADLWLCTIQFAKLFAKKYPTEGIKIAKAQNENKPKFGLNPLLLGLGITPKVGAHSAGVDTENTDTLLQFLFNAKTEYVSLIKRLPQESNLIKKGEGDIDDCD